MALFIGLLCALSSCSIGSRAMTTGVVTSSVPAVTTGAAHAEVKNDDSLKKLSRSRQSPSQKRTAVIYGKKTVTVTTAAVLLTAVGRTLMSSGKLRQCLHAMNKAGGEIEGNKRRRLAEGGADDGKGVSLDATSVGCR
ncbi:UNVERIFIED_CONTAM: Toxoplasma gondii family B protein [Hammondia hammondi]|eukprot:XP_008886052.1 Toxoplasma gondii family B protein [Hammondia hammondi]